MDKFDERQEYVRGKIMTRAFILNVVLLFALAFINDFHMYDVEKKIGFCDAMIVLACINITYVSVATILSSSYFAPVSKSKKFVYLFTFLTVVLVILSMLHIVNGKRFTAVNIVSLFMTISITVSMWMRRADWKSQS